MRNIFTAALLLSVFACDDGGMVDQTIQRGVRQSAVQACVGWIPNSPVAAVAGLDGDRLCACAADRLLAEKNVVDLGELRPDSPEARVAIVQCVAEIQTRAPTPEPS